MNYILIVSAVIFLIGCQTTNKNSAAFSYPEAGRSIAQTVALNCDQSRPNILYETVSNYLTEYGLQKGVTDFRSALYKNLDDVRYLGQLTIDLEESKKRSGSVWRRLNYNKPQNFKEAQLRPMGLGLEKQLKIEAESLEKQIKILEGQKLAQINKVQILLSKADSRIKYGNTNNPNDIHEESFYLDVQLENGKFLAGEPGLQFGCSVKFVVRNRAKISMDMKYGKVDAFLYDGTSECTASYPASVVGIISRDFKKQCTPYGDFHQKTLIPVSEPGDLGDTFRFSY